MATRRPRTDLAVSLFPFLSILACVMGILTLLIAALAVGQMESSPAADPSGESETPISTWVERIAERSRGLSRYLQEQARVERIRGVLEHLGLDPEATPEQVEQQLEDRARIAELVASNRENLEEIEEIRGALTVLETEVDRLADLPNDAPIEILPAGVGDRLAPYFVEVRGDGLRFRQRNGLWSPLINLDDLHERGLFKVFLENVRSRGNATAIFLIRPEGSANFRRAELIASQKFVRFGKLAIPGEGPINFNAVERPGRGGGSS
jgi:hypothetical protein